MQRESRVKLESGVKMERDVKRERDEEHKEIMASASANKVKGPIVNGETAEFQTRTERKRLEKHGRTALQ